MVSHDQSIILTKQKMIILIVNLFVESTSKLVDKIFQHKKLKDRADTCNLRSPPVNINIGVDIKCAKCQETPKRNKTQHMIGPQNEVLGMNG